ncbi:MAG: DNA-directed RNA polymerase subunit D [Candidatus Bathyarchaeia archaeon]
MQVRILEARGNTLRFYINGLDIEVANALRRTMIADVPTMAVEDVMIVENTSPIRDEVLAHRLGLVPLKTDLESYVPRELCECRSELGCGKCSVTLTLEAEATDSPRTVYSRELESSDPEVVPVSGNIPLVKLARGQRIRLEAYARLGTGREHAKWQPVSVSAYRYAVQFSLDAEKCNLCLSCVTSCPKHLLQKDDGKLILSRPENCDLCKECMNSCPREALTVSPEKNAFVFSIESTGSLEPQEIFLKAIEIMKDKADVLIDELQQHLRGQFNEKNAD